MKTKTYNGILANDYAIQTSKVSRVFRYLHKREAESDNKIVTQDICFIDLFNFQEIKKSSDTEKSKTYITFNTIYQFIQKVFVSRPITAPLRTQSPIINTKYNKCF